MSETQKAPPPIALDWGFLRRTVLSTVVTVLLIALFSSVYYSMAWAARYALFALWTLSFLSLSALIFKCLLFERRRALGLVFCGLKVALLAALFVLAKVWPVTEGADYRPAGVAMIFGAVTPLGVLVLRAVGLALTARGRAGARAPFARSRRPGAGEGQNGEMKTHP